MQRACHGVQGHVHADGRLQAGQAIAQMSRAELSVGASKPSLSVAVPLPRSTLVCPPHTLTYHMHAVRAHKARSKPSPADTTPRLECRGSSCRLHACPRRYNLIAYRVTIQNAFCKHTP